jgi:hypothetical protein
MIRKVLNITTHTVRWFKPSLITITLALFLAYSCDKKDEDVKPTFSVKVKLNYPEGYSPAVNVRVTLRNTINGEVITDSTNAAGVTDFDVIVGTYEATASEERSDEYFKYLINGTKGNIIVTDAWTGEDTVQVPLTVTTQQLPVEGDNSALGKVVIKEVYNGGCRRDDGSGAFRMDQYVILYNNSNQPASLTDLCLASPMPANAHATNNFMVDGALSYASEGWIPAGFGVWAIQGDVTLDPGKQIVIALTNAIDNTVTYSNSINFANPEYYCAYDIEVYSNTTYYPSPSELIPTSHYLKAHKFAGTTGNAWVLSVNSPALFVFVPDGVTPSEYAGDADRTVLHGSGASQVCKKTPVEWIVDGIEIYQKGNVNSKKRLTATVDVGYVELTGDQGFTLYRNVDKNATEAILANAGKIVYNYSLGTTGEPFNGTTDPSGIDAEASIRNGARIIYKDTNNATNDFHQRSRASLR